MSQALAANARGRLAAVLLVAVPLVALHADDWARLGPRWWNDPNYTHGFFVPLFALYFVWEKWDRIQRVPLRPSLLGLPLLLVGLALKMATLFYDSLFIACTAMVVVIAGAVLLTGGRGLLRALLVPIAFLFLMMPLPLPIYERIALPLQTLAAAAGTTVLQAVGIAALREGNVIHLSQRTLEIADACSGMRFLTGFIALGVAFAYLSRRPTWERAVLVASTIPIAILANILRVTATSFFAHWGWNFLVDGVPHRATALVLFACSAVVLWGEYYVLSHLFVPEPSPDQAT